jgi:hypothetical protein
MIPIFSNHSSPESDINENHQNNTKKNPIKQYVQGGIVVQGF